MAARRSGLVINIGSIVADMWVPSHPSFPASMLIGTQSGAVEWTVFGEQGRGTRDERYLVDGAQAVQYTRHVHCARFHPLKHREQPGRTVQVCLPAPHNSLILTCICRQPRPDLALHHLPPEHHTTHPREPGPDLYARRRVRQGGRAARAAEEAAGVPDARRECVCVQGVRLAAKGLGPLVYVASLFAEDIDGRHSHLYVHVCLGPIARRHHVYSPLSFSSTSRPCPPNTRLIFRRTLRRVN